MDKKERMQLFSQIYIKLLSKKSIATIDEHVRCTWTYFHRLLKELEDKELQEPQEPKENTMFVKL